MQGGQWPVASDDQYQKVFFIELHGGLIYAEWLVKNLELTEAQRRTMAETGEALYKIREKRLFRQTHVSFEEYVRERWHVPQELVDMAIEFYLASRN
jgi:HD-like signal output (HDOD) protein